MTKLRELYRCEICGNVVEITHEGAPALVCCEKPMTKLEAKTQDEGKEKHVPAVEETGEGIKVRVGSVAHPYGRETSYKVHRSDDSGQGAQGRT